MIPNVMNTTEILEQLTEIFRQIFDNNAIVLTPETTAADIAEWDSFNHINIIVAVEVHFGIKFQTAETEELKNVCHLIELIQQKLEAQKR
jgi:acyl carrier protein